MAAGRGKPGHHGANHRNMKPMNYSDRPWQVSAKFDERLNGYPIVSSAGRVVAIATYLGGTEPARENAELIVKAVNALTSGQ